MPNLIDLPSTSTLISADRIFTREDLSSIPTPQATVSHKPVPHHEIVGALVETLGFRHIGIHDEKYSVSKDGQKLWGCLDLDTPDNQGFDGARFSIGLRNSHDRSMSLGLTVGYRVMVCQNGAFSGDFKPVCAKHSKNFNLLNSLSVGVDQMQRNFAPLIQQVNFWKGYELTGSAAKCLIYEAFVQGGMELPKHLIGDVHRYYFDPQYAEFEPRNVWSLSNAFTSAAKELDPIPMYKAQASIGEFFDQRFKK